MSHFLPPVRIRSRATGMPYTVHALSAHTELATGLSLFLTVEGTLLAADAREGLL